MKFVTRLIRCSIIVLTAKIATGYLNVQYPPAQRDETNFYTYNGTQKVYDPYPWLEEETSATEKFIKNQNQLAEPFITKNNQFKEIKKLCANLANYPKFSVPERIGKYYFTFENSGLQDQDVLYKQDTLDGPATEFLNPNKIGKKIALIEAAFSENGLIYAYACSKSGSDDRTIKFRNVETGKDLKDSLQAKETVITWTHDNLGIFYCRYLRDGDEDHTLFYHRLGEPQAKDTVVAQLPRDLFTRPEPETEEEKEKLLKEKKRRHFAEVSYDGQYLIVMTTYWKGDYDLFYYHFKPNDKNYNQLKLIKLTTNRDAEYEFITNTGPKLVFRTDKDATHERIIVINVGSNPRGVWTTLILGNAEYPMVSVRCVDENKLLIEHNYHVKSILRVYSLADGSPIRQLQFDIGHIAAISGHRKYAEIFFRVESFISPGLLYRYVFEKNRHVDPKIIRVMTLNFQSFSVDDFIVEQVFYESSDHTKIPMFITQKKNTKGKKAKPCYMYGYGGMGISVEPSFSELAYAFITIFDGIYAVPNIRGGLEYGMQWWEAGMLLKKQNVFNDFLAAALLLVTMGYTKYEMIAIHGHSNGGLLVGACITQQPAYFGAAIAEVGIFDMLRFPKLGEIGEVWIDEYGNPQNLPDFRNLYAYSPYRKVRIGPYPSVLLTTSKNDERVPPCHSYKMAAALQYASKDQKNIVLLRVYDNGHGIGKSTAKRVEENAEILAFLKKTLKLSISRDIVIEEASEKVSCLSALKCIG